MSLFCDHKRLRTTCPECRPPPPPPPPPKLAAARAAKEPEAPKGPRALGQPVRRRSKRISPEEADAAEAWWVRKD